VNTPLRSLNGQRFDPNIAFFIPVSAVFPDASAGKYLLRSLLGELDREDAVFTAAKLNLIVSDTVNDHSLDVHCSIRHQNLQADVETERKELRPDYGKISDTDRNRYVRAEQMYLMIGRGA
jgi:hypothetical protein